jgi:hypothetical protein
MSPFSGGFPAERPPFCPLGGDEEGGFSGVRIFLGPSVSRISDSHAGGKMTAY